MAANAVTRKAVVDMIMAIVQRGANVQAGNVLRELSAAYEFAIGLGYFADEFANPAILVRGLKEPTTCTGMRRSVGCGYRSGRIIWTRSFLSDTAQANINASLVIHNGQGSRLEIGNLAQAQLLIVVQSFMNPQVSP